MSTQPLRFTSILAVDQTCGSTFAKACNEAWAAACAPVPAARGTSPCGFVATAVAFLLAEGVALADIDACEREELVLQRASQLMRSVAASRRAYVAAHAGEFGDAAAAVEFVTAWCGQWDLAALLSASPAPRVAYLRLVRRPAAAAATPARYWTFCKQDEEATKSDKFAVVREWFGQEEAFWAVGDEVFVQEGARSMRVCEWLQLHHGAPLPPIIVDGAGHFWAEEWRDDGSAVRVFESLPDNITQPHDVTAAFALALAAARVEAQRAAAAGE